jgi:CHASE2 domain-containing sensor protein
MYDARLVMNAYAAFGTGGAVVALVGGAMVLWTDDKNSKLFAVGAVTALAGVLVACYAVFFLGGR